MTHVRRAKQVHLNHFLKIFNAGVLERAVTKNPGIIQNDIYTTKLCYRPLNNRRRLRWIADRVIVGNSAAARCADVFNHFVRSKP